ncbi:MAG: AEC family transporter [Campylobacterales bacterium]|nr:AEC family transporter [Campylobacterales bacterium]
MNTFIIYISLPATILLQVPKLSFDTSLISLIITPWLLLIFAVIAVLVITKNYSSDVRASLLMTVPLGNTSFVGIPLIETFIGSNAIGYALIYDQLGSFLMLSIYGGAILAYYEHGKIDVLFLLKKILFFPPFIFLIIAFSVKVSFFSNVESYLKILSQTLVPLALVSVGFSLVFKLNEFKAIFVKALFLKLLVLPFIAFLFLYPFDIEEVVFKTAILESAMPSMITAGALAINANFAPNLSASMVGIGLLVSLVTIPIINLLI